MDEIADRAGVSKPVLYQHFSSSWSCISRCCSATWTTWSPACANAAHLPTTASGCGAVAGLLRFRRRQPGYRLIFGERLRDRTAGVRAGEGRHRDRVRAVFDLISRDSGLEAHRAKDDRGGLVSTSVDCAATGSTATAPSPKEAAVEGTCSSPGAACHVPLTRSLTASAPVPKPTGAHPPRRSPHEAIFADCRIAALLVGRCERLSRNAPW